MTTADKTRRPAMVFALRAIAALTVIGSAAAVTILSVRADDQVEAVTTAQSVSAAAPSSAGGITVAPGPVPGGAGGEAGAPLAGAPAAGVPAGGGQGAAAPNGAVPLGGAAGPRASVPSGGGAVPGDSVQLGAASPFAAVTVNTQPACPLGWPAPKQQGGLASLIGLAPLAGPFSSEAFALGSVYQPILQLVGPVLAEIAPVITANQPWIDPLITRVQAVEAVVLEAILPYYGPYRDQLIAAEGEFAKQLTPILTTVYNSEAASCFVAWQGQIIDQAKGGRITVASLAHPGTVVELGPEG
ncbi:hypothetical protein JK358_28910 [Nocardia sp. 2]|uniref:Uncharacterized protein n=1 Tax=Nocardia acididurans TaxID=2802282 RepID=A0ABS1MCZ3_9NOCA|nr:hypothetical protein [Nocardia acididurans]MBL1078434.1 hypothetical protein [Nocardia acididurans]